MLFQSTYSSGTAVAETTNETQTLDPKDVFRYNAVTYSPLVYYLRPYCLTGQETLVPEGPDLSCVSTVCVS